MPSVAELVEYLKGIAEGIHYLIRGSQGLPPEEERYANLMNLSDRKETTRVTIRQIYEHTYMRAAQKIYGDEMELMQYIADTEDAYLVSKDGEQRREAILMQKARSQPANMETLQIVAPNTQTPLTQEQHKKHFWSRGEKKNEPNA